ncbi:hypothetical protein MTR_1172s0010 [Medicago truncatula]|uniref:Uncharacterized protein n=1 Tax=Medicago truncatula TaxID=3880 RepID=A0A072TDW8_MEDTR|nr:hypothetical protein MTR_1172s0010 [Medicago truncatula]
MAGTGEDMERMVAGSSEWQWLSASAAWFVRPASAIEFHVKRVDCSKSMRGDRELRNRGQTTGRIQSVTKSREE